VEQFFEFQQTQEEDKISLAAYHLEGEVQMWYQLFKQSEELISWETLKAGLYIRYGPTPFEDHFGELTKLQQLGSVREYQLQFEKLLSRVGELSSAHLSVTAMTWLCGWQLGCALHPCCPPCQGMTRECLGLENG
jgi:hypothetical protein